MRVLFAITHLNFWLPLEPVAQEYCESGHTVSVLFEQTYRQKFEKRYIFDPEMVSYDVGWMNNRGDRFQFLLKYSREILNYAAYWRLRQPTSRLLVDRWAIYIPYPIRLLTYTKFGRSWLSSDIVWRTLKKLESSIPPSRRLVTEIQHYAPDILVAASAIMPYSNETEYLKAARQLGIPTIVIVPSWDNLTTKGILHEIPDWLFVWTEGQVEEAEKFHNMPGERVICTGAPKYDPWFELKPVIAKEEFCQGLGINPSDPYALYLCSSKFISRDETVFVDQLADCLAKTPELCNLTLLVRPHPQNLAHWENYKSKHANVVVWSKDLNIMNPSMTIQDFYHSLLYSHCVLGINTSAFIEAAIVDKPCIAIAASQYEFTQMGIPHFKHLLDADFLELPRGIDETAEVVLRIVKGEDSKKEKRREFVHNFVRPNGLDIPASRVIAKSIMNVASGKLPYDQAQIHLV
jgi:hypothetical protein